MNMIRLRNSIVFFFGFLAFNWAVPNLIGYVLHTNLGQYDEVTLSFDGKYALIGSISQHYQILNAQSGTRLAEFSSHYLNILPATFMFLPATHEYLDIDNTISTIDTNTGMRTQDYLDSYSYRSDPASISSDGKWVILSTRCDVKLWSVEQRRVVKYIEPSKCSDSPRSVAISPDGTLVAVATSTDARIYDANTSTLIQTLSFPVNPDSSPSAQYVAFSPDNTMLLADKSDDSTTLYDIATAQRKCPQLPGSSQFAFSPDRIYIALADRSNLTWWNVKTCSQKHQLTLNTGADLPRLTFSPDSKTILAAIYLRGVRRWDTETGASLASIPWIDNGVLSTVTCVGTPIVYVVFYLLLLRIFPSTKPISNPRFSS